MIDYLITTTAVWIRRIGHCRGFGIQSPSDYWFVRYIINEHWPYYSYETLGQDDDKLTRKLGRLFFRIANWLQPEVIESKYYHEYFQAGCHKAKFGVSKELILLSPEESNLVKLEAIYNKVDVNSVLIVNEINHAQNIWKEIVNDERTGVTFDLYYCGIVFFDKRRHKMNYIINF